MLDIYICEKNESDRSKVLATCNEYYIDHNYDNEIYSCEDGDRLIEMVNDRELTALYFIDCKEVSELLMDRIRKSAVGSYIVLMSDEMKTILDMVSPTLRPSGYLVLPVKKDEVKNILQKICDSYEDMTGESATFRFKIRSRIYSVDINNIDYFEAANKKMIIRTVNQEYEYYGNFESIREVLPDYFLRTHKSFFVNMKNVKNIDFKEMWLSMKDGAVAYISRGYKKDVEDFVKAV